MTDTRITDFESQGTIGKLVSYFKNNHLLGCAVKNLVTEFHCLKFLNRRYTVFTMHFFLLKLFLRLNL